MLAEIKQLAARTDRTLTSVIEDALREMLARQQEAGERAFVSVPTASGGGLQPGVDLDDSAALLSLMEEPSDPA